MASRVTPIPGSDDVADRLAISPARGRVRPDLGHAGRATAGPSASPTTARSRWARRPTAPVDALRGPSELDRVLPTRERSLRGHPPAEPTDPDVRRRHARAAGCTSPYFDRDRKTERCARWSACTPSPTPRADGGLADGAPPRAGGDHQSALHRQLPRLPLGARMWADERRTSAASTSAVGTAFGPNLPRRLEREVHTARLTAVGTPYTRPSMTISPFR